MLWEGEEGENKKERKICLDTMKGKTLGGNGVRLEAKAISRGCRKKKNDGDPNREVAARVPRASMAWKVI